MQIYAWNHISPIFYLNGVLGFTEIIADGISNNIPPKIAKQNYFLEYFIVF